MNKKLSLLLSFILLIISLDACTIGIAMPEATANGRPIIYKNRDITSQSLEFETYNPSDGYHYAYNSYISNSTAWMGVNEAGFGCVQSAAYNISSEGGSGLGNGNLINYVLRRCETVAEFQAILDSTNATGRSTAANYAVFDAYGNGAMFECANWEYARYEPDENGIITRGNFSYIGSSARRGLERMNRAHELMTAAFEDDSLDPKFIGMHVVADLERTGNDPYPLPFTGSFPGCPAGWVDCDSSNIETINNEQTLCSGVIQGVAPGENPDLSHMYCYFACPAVSVPFVIFPASETQPEDGRGYGGALRPLCFDRYDDAFHSGDETLFDTHVLVDPDGGGIWEYSRPINRWAYDTVETAIDIWLDSPPATEELAEFQDTVMARVLRAYGEGYPVSIGEEKSTMPEEVAIKAYPNPFNSAITIDRPENRQIQILDIKGNLVDELALGEEKWHPEDDIGSGIYIIHTSREKLGLLRDRRIIYIK
ncbi:MAG: T9SS type A sorting domain-containing protein [Candidatus Zixiibacteriota bacterium]